MPLETILSHGSTSNPARASAASGDGGAVEGRVLELSAASWGSTGIERLRNQTAPEKFAIGHCASWGYAARLLAKGKCAQRESLQEASRPSKQMLHQPCHHVGGGRSQDPLAVERGCEAEPPDSVISDTFQDLGPLISQRTPT